MAETKRLGAVTSYAAAVEGGYSGTYEEWAALLGNFSSRADEVKANAEQVALDKTAAAASEANAKASETDASASASAAAESAEAALVS